MNLPEWLTAPDPPLPGPDHLPDPVARMGRHVVWFFDCGTATKHSDYTTAHDGACPPGCRPLPWGAPADPFKVSPAWEAWRAYTRGIEARAQPQTAIADDEPDTVPTVLGPGIAPLVGGALYDRQNPAQDPPGATGVPGGGGSPPLPELPQEEHGTVFALCPITEDPYL